MSHVNGRPHFLFHVTVPDGKMLDYRRRDTMNYFPMVIMLLLSLLGTCSAAVEIKDTPHYDVVAEYIRSLSAIHNI